MSKRYNNYHKHDHVGNISTPDTNAHAEDYIRRCVEYGHTNYFTTNHGTMGDIFEALSLCEKYGLKCIAGLEGYIVPDASDKTDASNYHIVIIPKTNTARKKLNIISSRAHMEGFYYKPRIFLEDLLTKLDGDDVFITSACVAGLLKTQDSIEKILLPLVEHFGTNVYLEVQSHNVEDQIAINRKAIVLSESLGLKLIAANDSHYVNENDYNERIELLKGKGINYSDEGSFTLDFPKFDIGVERFVKQGLFTREQAERLYLNTLDFDICEPISINKEIKMPTIYPKLSLAERCKLLQSKINDGFDAIRIKEKLTDNEVSERLAGIEYEMKTVRDTNDIIHTADYFLLNERIVDLAVNKYGGVLTRGGRGSCGSFYINKTLGLTQLDRFSIKLPIYPDRFASTARLIENRSLPDIDFNIKEQEPFVKASRELLGEHGCYPMIAYGTMKLGEAFRNVCRSKGFTYAEYNDVAKNIEDHMDDPKWMPVIAEAKRYEGTIVSGSVHPCAHLIMDEDIIEELGVIKVGNAYCVMMTSAEADEYKYLKDDFLVVSVWALISETFDMIGQPIMDAKTLLETIKNDDGVWDLFKNGLTCTLNQVDSDNGMAQAKQYGIRSFEDGAFVAAAIRPSFDSWRDKFLRRVDYSTGSADLDKVLDMTNHYILFQENLMQYFEWLGVSPAESIGLIKKISKKKIHPEDFTNLEGRLKDAWVKNTGSSDMFEETWKMIQSCISYGFAAPHAAATSLDMCYGAYLKAHHPLEYYSVCFNNYSDDMVRTSKLKEELKYFGISLKGIKFRQSRSSYSPDPSTNTIYKGIKSIKFMNDRIGEQLYEVGKHTHNGFIDFLYDASENVTMDSRQLDILIRIGFFEEFGDTGKLIRLAELFKEFASKKQIKKDKIREYELPLRLAGKYSTKMTKTLYKTTPELIRELLMEWEETVEYTQIPLKDRIKTELEYLGYIEYRNPNVANTYIIVTNLDTKYSPKFIGYCIKNGQSCEFKVSKKRSKEYRNGFAVTPFENGDIINIKGTKKKQKQRKTDDGFVPVQGEFNWWITDYEVKDTI